MQSTTTKFKNGCCNTQALTAAFHAFPVLPSYFSCVLVVAAVHLDLLTQR